MRLYKMLPLFCENDLGDNDAPALQSKVSDENIWNETQGARVAAHEIVKDATGEIKELELKFWLAQVGSKGEAVVPQSLLHALPTQKVVKDIASSIRDIKTLVDGKLFSFIGADTQSKVTTVLKWLKTMAQERCPKITEGDTNLSQIVERLGYFMRSDLAADGDCYKVGREELIQRLANVKANKEVTLKEMRQFVCFGWLLDEAVLRSAQNITDPLFTCQKTKRGLQAPPTRISAATLITRNSRRGRKAMTSWSARTRRRFLKIRRGLSR